MQDHLLITELAQASTDVVLPLADAPNSRPLQVTKASVDLYSAGGPGASDSQRR
jgi:hypothetical protein